MSEFVIDLTESQEEESWKPEIREPIVDREEAFHERECCRLPSECVCPNVGWLWATHSKQVNTNFIRSGKWMLFPDSDAVDEAWLKVVDLLADQQLGGCAKVAPVGRKQNNKHVICVYTNDHENVKEVFTVLHALRNSGIRAATDCTLNYKTDDATYAAVYASDSAAQAAGFAGVSLKAHKNFKVSKYTSVGFRGTSKVMLKLNNIGPEHLCSLVAEMPITATRREIDTYFSRLPATAAVFAQEALDTIFHGNALVTDFYLPERDLSSSGSFGSKSPSSAKKPKLED